MSVLILMCLKCVRLKRVSHGVPACSHHSLVPGSRRYHGSLVDRVILLDVGLLRLHGYVLGIVDVLLSLDHGATNGVWSSTDAESVLV